LEKTSAQQQYKKMTETPVDKLIISLAIPTIVSMMVTGIYNTADTWFVSRIGTSASGAVSIVMSLMAIFQAIGFMHGHGAGSSISRKLGAGEPRDAITYASTSFYLCFLVSGIVAVLGLIFMDPLLRLLGSTDTILPYARQYVFWILLSGPFLSVSCVLNNILRYEGHAVYAMAGLMTGGLLNMAGDPIFMFGLHMGVSGAGLSTAISQLISFFILLFMYRKKDVVSRFRIRSVSHSPAVVFGILSVGFPSLMRQGMNSLSTILLNHQAAAYGDAAIAAMGITGKVIMLMASLAVGIGQGLQPVASYNYGAQKYSRVKKGFRFTYLSGCAVLSVLAVLCIIFAPQVIAWFRDDPEVIRIGTTALRLQAVCCFFMSYSIAAGMLFQSTGIAGRATFLSALRSGLLFIPFILILPHFWGLTGIEAAQPLADLISTLISIPITVNFLHSLPEDGLPEDKAAAAGADGQNP